WKRGPPARHRTACKRQPLITTVRRHTREKAHLVLRSGVAGPSHDGMATRFVGYLSAREVGWRATTLGSPGWGVLVPSHLCKSHRRREARLGRCAVSIPLGWNQWRSARLLRRQPETHGVHAYLVTAVSGGSEHCLRMAVGERL